MNYTPLSPVSPEDDTPHNHNRIDEDAISILSDAAPLSGYQAYRPPQSQEYTPSPITGQQPALPYKQPTITYTRESTPSPIPTLPYKQTTITHTEASSRLPTPPTHNPISWPGIFPSRTPSSSKSPVSSLGFRAQIFANKGRDHYEEVLPWAESTNFRNQSTSVESRPERKQSGGARGDGREKQYHRKPRHLRRTWKTGATRRFPWKAGLAMSMVCLLTGSSIALLYASDKTTPESYPTSIQPATYLAVLELLTALLTLGALAEGVVICFWTTLLHGATIGDIHDVYDSAALWPAICMAVKLQFNRVGVATICAAMSLVRGPLFQRSLVLKEGKYELNVIPMAVGMAISFASILSLFPLHYGYWHLGRVVSLNPLEIARAFGAPLFEGVDGNVTARDIELERGNVSVRYGAMERNGEEKALRIEDVGRCNVRVPNEAEIFG